MSGLAAYAAKQANLCDQMAASSALLWLPALHRNGLSTEWGARYTIGHTDINLPSSAQGGVTVPQDVDDDADADDEVIDDVANESDNVSDGGGDMLDIFELDD